MLWMWNNVDNVDMMLIMLSWFSVDLMLLDMLIVCYMADRSWCDWDVDSDVDMMLLG